jgi:surface antigen
MRHASKLVVSVFAAALAVAGCARQGGPSTGEAVGGAGGAVLGGLAGSQIGSGTGKLIATGAGAALGALIGSQVGKKLSEQDERRMSQTTGQALENNEDGEASTWENPNSDHRGRVKPVETYQRDDGTYCREFQHTVYIDGEAKDAYGTACRQPNGDWKIVET